MKGRKIPLSLGIKEVPTLGWLKKMELQQCLDRAAPPKKEAEVKPHSG